MNCGGTINTINTTVLADAITIGTTTTIFFTFFWRLGTTSPLSWPQSATVITEEGFYFAGRLQASASSDTLVAGASCQKSINCIYGSVFYCSGASFHFSKKESCSSLPGLLLCAFFFYLTRIPEDPENHLTEGLHLSRVHKTSRGL